MKHILIQYIDMVQEKEELKRRINKLSHKLDRINREGNVKDTVKGGAGGWQSYHIEGSRWQLKMRPNIY